VGKEFVQRGDDLFGDLVLAVEREPCRPHSGSRHFTLHAFGDLERQGWIGTAVRNEDAQPCASGILVLPKSLIDNRA
jgi:hypothetical protein